MADNAQVPSTAGTGTDRSEERRVPARTNVLIPALAVCDDGTRYRCVLRDISAEGARIGLSAQHRLPRSFRLVTDKRPQGYPVRLVWQNGAFAGLTLDLAQAG